MTSPIPLAFFEAGGFNPLDLTQGGNAFWTWLIFLAALVPIWKLVMGPMTRSMAARDDAIRAAAEAAQKASAEAQLARAEVERKLSEAQAEASRTLAAARANAEAREREIMEQAKAASEQLLARARADIQTEQDKALATIRKQVVDLSLAAAGQVLKRKVDAADDRRLVEELVAAAPGTSPARNQGAGQGPPGKREGRP